MGFKSKEEMFGDGGGFGPQVAISFVEPPGYDTGNRGIAFGEQLTAAIANRPHYALALNDEDLNTRLAAFEAGGLDGAYDNGAVGPAGGGREVAKTDGAIQTNSVVSSATTGDAAGDLSHFRANAVGDTAAGSIGFEFAGKRTAANGQSGNDPIAGFMDRKVLAKSGGQTQLAYTQAATLNPSGSASTTVRLTTGQFHVAGDTDLLMKGVDLVQISGSASDDGFYYYSNSGTLNTEAILTAIDGTNPSLAASSPCTVTVWRTQFATYGAHSIRVAGTEEILMTPLHSGGSGTVLHVKSGSQGPGTNTGASVSLKFSAVTAKGAELNTTYFDSWGRFTAGFSSADTSTTDQRFGSAATFRYYASTETQGIGHIVQAYDVLSETYDYLSLVPIDPAVTPGLLAPIPNITYSANSPVDGEVLFTLAQDANLARYLYGGGGMMVELGSSGGDIGGLYQVMDVINTGNKGFRLRKLDGTIPSHLPVAGNAQVYGFFAVSALGRKHTFDNANPVLAGDTTPVVGYNTLSGGHDSNAASLVLWGAQNTGGSKRAHLRAFTPSPGTGDGYRETFKVDVDGTIHSYGSIVARLDIQATNLVATDSVNAYGSVFADADGSGAGEFQYGSAAAKVRTVIVPSSSFIPVDLTGDIVGPPFRSEGESRWRWGLTTSNAGYLQNVLWTNATNLYVKIPLNGVLVSGCLLTRVRLLIGGTSGTWTGTLYRASPDFANTVFDADLMIPVIASLGTNTTAALTTDAGVVTIPVSHTVDLSTNEYYVLASPSAVGAAIVAAEVRFEDPGPRNY